MKMPFITRKRFEVLQSELHDKTGRTVVYVPTKYPIRNGKPVQIPGGEYCYHDPRIGWVQRVEFETYREYEEYLKKAKAEPNFEEMREAAKKAQKQELEEGETS